MLFESIGLVPKGPRHLGDGGPQDDPGVEDGDVGLRGRNELAVEVDQGFGHRRSFEGVGQDRGEAETPERS